MDNQDPYLQLTKCYVLHTRSEMLLAKTDLTELTSLERERHLKTLAEVREEIAQMKRGHPDVDFDILATQLTYWDPELEKRYPNITDWSVFPS
jgi:predicted kinase